MHEIVTQMVEFAVNGENAPGYLARPEGDEGLYPGVVVFQEWWGLDDHIKSVVERMGQAGFVAIAPDFYRGEVAAEPDDARRLVMRLQIEAVLRDAQGALNYLLAQDNVMPKKAGVMGFCFGGHVAGQMSWRGQNVGAVVSFYGGGFKIDDEIGRKIAAPFLAIYGEADAGIPMEMVRENERQLQAHNIEHQVIVYPQAPHAFFNDTRASFRESAADDAWNRTLEWFSKYLVV